MTSTPPDGRSPAATDRSSPPTPPAPVTDPPAAAATAGPDGAADNHTIRRGRPSLAEAEQLAARILDASWDVLLDQGFENFTFDRVARHAHIGKATIYSRFTGKAELLEALLRHKITQRRERIQGIGAGLPAIEALCLRAARFLDALFEPDGILIERLMDWLDSEAGRTPGDGRAGSRLWAYRQAFETIGASLREAVDRAEIAPTDIPAAAAFWLEGVLGHARVLGSKGFASPPDHEAWSRRFSAYFLAGIAALPAVSTGRDPLPAPPAG